MAEAKQLTRPMRRTGPPGGRRAERFVEKEDRSAVESIREATGASVDVIQYHLRECGGDVNKATEELIDTPFTVVQSKKPKNKAMVRGRGRGRDYHNGKGGRSEAVGKKEGRHDRQKSLIAGRGRGGGQGPMRGRGGFHRNRSGPRAKTDAETSIANGTEVEKAKSAPPPPAPRRKDYLEAVRGKSKKPQPPPMKEEVVKSDILGEKQDGMSGWEVASSPPDTPVAAFRGDEGGTIPDEVVSDEEKSVHVDSTADVKGVQAKEDDAVPWADEVEDEKICDVPSEDTSIAHIFPIAMQDIRFTREDTTPLEPSSLPIPFRMDAAFTPSLNVENSPLDMSTIGYLFGTFEGLRTSQPDAETRTEPEEIVERPLVEEIPPLQPTSSGTPPEPEEVTERPESPQLRTEGGTNEGRSPLQRPSVELLPATVDASPPPQTEPASDFRLDAETQALDVEVPQPPAEQPSFIATSNPAMKEETSTSVHSHLVTTDASRSDKSFVNTMTSQAKPSQPLTTLEDASEFVKPYGEGFGVPVDNPKAEEIGNFEESRPRRPSPNLPESKPVLETDSSFGISSGPTPTLPSYQPQRHPPPHKLQEKPVPSVGAGVTGHPPNPKYNPHASGGGVPPPGPNPNPAVHVPSSLNPTNSGNSSVPMMQQAPFLNPGMMPNPAIPFPTGTPYYPQFMQYQHQMYHGLYAGTYGSFGAPFNHESVGHPAHASPVGVPPNQGNTVYDTANPSSFVNNKEKDVFLNQQQQQLSHAGFPGGPQPVPRNDGGMFYGVPGQAFSQGFRNQFHQPPGFGQFPGAGFVAPPHTYHPPGQQGTPNFRLH